MDAEEARVEHLKMIQAVVDRMGMNSFAVRATAATVAAGLVAVAASAKEPLATLGALAIVPLWVIDAYFLLTEREFRDLYNGVRQAAAATPGTPEYFSLDRPHQRGGIMKGLLPVMLWKTLPLFYFPLITLLTVAGVVFALR